jgi:hypothetical protein
LLFLEAVEEFSLLKSNQNRFQKALSMNQLFIKPGAKCELNISQHLRERILAEVALYSNNHCPNDVFDECLAIVTVQLKEDVFPRFIKSPEGKEFIDSRMFNTNQIDNSVEIMVETTGFDLSTPYMCDTEFEKMKEWAYLDEVNGIPWSVTAKSTDATLYTSKKGVKLFGNRAIRMWKLTGEIKAPIDTVLKAAFHLPYRIQNDGQLVETINIDFFDDCDISKYASTVAYERYSIPFISDREFIFAGSIKQELTDEALKRYVTARKTVNLTELGSPSKKKAIRAECIGGYICESVDASNTRTRYYEIGWIDIKGSVPLWMWNKIIKARGLGFHAGLQKSVKSYMKEKPTVINSARILETLDIYKRRQNQVT